MSRRTTRTTAIALCMLAPNLFGFLVFTAGPVIFSAIMAFTNWDLTLHNSYASESIKFIGLENFRELLFGDESGYFFKYLYNTLYFMLGIPIGIALSLIAALLLSKPVALPRGRSMLSVAGLTILLTAITMIGVHMAGASPLCVFFVCITGVLVLLGLSFGQVTFRTLFYLPNLTAGVAIFILWKSLYNPENGPINRTIQPVLDALTGLVHGSPAEVWLVAGWVVRLIALALFIWITYGTVRRFRDADTGLVGLLFSELAAALIFVVIWQLGYVLMQLPNWVASEAGLFAPKWLVSVRWAKPAIMIMGIFTAIGSNNMLLYLAALSNVPVELYEASSIDGADPWQTFWNITWPQLAPTTFFIVVMSFIGGLQGGFEQARVMTNGGPAGSTTTLSYYLYLRGFGDFRLGFASAIAWVMFIMIFLITIANWKFGSKMVND